MKYFCSLLILLCLGCDNTDTKHKCPKTYKIGDVVTLKLKQQEVIVVMGCRREYGPSNDCFYYVKFDSEGDSIKVYEAEIKKPEPWI